MNRTNRNRYPLRRILRTRLSDIMGKPVEMLECGHEQYARNDIFGPTSPVRRRCRKCHDGKPAEFNPSGESAKP